MVPPDSTMPDKIELTKMVFNLMYRYLIFTGLFYLVFYLLLYSSATRLKKVFLLKLRTLLSACSFSAW
jgi:hypothetical protein